MIEYLVFLWGRGFPRTVTQAKALEQALADRNMPIDAVISFSIEQTELVERLVGRRVCLRSHGEWHVRFNPPRVPGRCDVCGEPLIQREDDQEDRIRTRMKAYSRDTEPLIGFYSQRGLLTRIDALGAMEDIAAQIEQRVSVAP